VEGAFPAGAGADVVEVGGAVCVGLGPFAAEGWTEAFSIDGSVFGGLVTERYGGGGIGLTQSSCPDSVSSGPSTLCKHS
jgi:hypothetical protein